MGWGAGGNGARKGWGQNKKMTFLRTNMSKLKKKKKKAMKA